MTYWGNNFKDNVSALPYFLALQLNFNPLLQRYIKYVVGLPLVCALLIFPSRVKSSRLLDDDAGPRPHLYIMGGQYHCDRALDVADHVFPVCLDVYRSEFWQCHNARGISLGMSLFRSLFSFNLRARNTTVDLSSLSCKFTFFRVEMFD